MTFHIGRKSFGRISPELPNAVIKFVDVGQMSIGLTGKRFLLTMRQKRQRFIGITSGDMQLRQREQCIEPVPRINAPFHGVGLLILLYRFVKVALFFMESAEIAMTERDAQMRISLNVFLHGQTIVGPSRIQQAIMFVNGTKIGIVNGLPQCTSKLFLALECLTENGIGRYIIAKTKGDVADAVERNHPILTGNKTETITKSVTIGQCPVVVLGGLVQHTHAPVVGANTVQRIHNFLGVTKLNRNIITLPM